MGSGRDCEIRGAKGFLGWGEHTPYVIGRVMLIWVAARWLRFSPKYPKRRPRVVHPPALTKTGPAAHPRGTDQAVAGVLLSTEHEAIGCDG
jgi:hypothetical protein